MRRAELEIPLFPLRTVLFPGGALPLRVFEQRYLGLVGECMREGYGFGVCLIQAGEEVGAPAEVYEIGTLAEIVDWNSGEDGILQITALGRRRFRVLARRTDERGLVRARVSLLAEAGSTALPQRYRPLAELLRLLIERIEGPYADIPRHFQDAVWVGGRLFELLPLPNEEKYRYLTVDDPLERLRGLLRSLLHHGLV